MPVTLLVFWLLGEHGGSLEKSSFAPPVAKDATSGAAVYSAACTT